MVRASRSRHIDAAPEVVFAALSDPALLPSMLPRVSKVDILSRTPEHARIATHMSFAPFGTMRSEGDVHWRDGREVLFEAKKPVVVQARWSLSPANGGTDVTAELALDLAPMLGPLSGFVPDDQVRAMLVPDLDTALQALDQHIAAQRA